MQETVLMLLLIGRMPRTSPQEALEGLHRTVLSAGTTVAIVHLILLLMENLVLVVQARMAEGVAVHVGLETVNGKTASISLVQQTNVWSVSSLAYPTTRRSFKLA